MYSCKDDLTLNYWYILWAWVIELLLNWKIEKADSKTSIFASLFTCEYILLDMRKFVHLWHLRVHTPLDSVMHVIGHVIESSMHMIYMRESLVLPIWDFSKGSSSSLKLASSRMSEHILWIVDPRLASEHNISTSTFRL